MRQGISSEQIDLCVSKLQEMKNVFAEAVQEQKEQEEKEESGKAFSTILKGTACIVIGLGVFAFLVSIGIKWKLLIAIALYGVYLVGKGIYYKVKGIVKK